MPVVLSACSADSNTFTPPEPITGATSSVVEDALVQETDDRSTTGDGVLEDPALPSTAQPRNVELTILEDTSVNSFFSVTGIPDEQAFPVLTYRIVTEPSHGSIVHEPGESAFTYMPERNFEGVDTFDYDIANGNQASVTINVSGVNDGPVVFADIVRVIEQGEAYEATVVVSDPDEVDTHLLEANNLPRWLSLNTRTGELTGTPLLSDIGLFSDIEFSVTDAAGLTSEMVSVSIEVIALNDAPIINVDQFPEDIDAGEEIEVDLFPDDPNGDPVEVAFEQNDLLDIAVSGGKVRVVALEVNEVTEVDMVLFATDVRGGVARSVVPFRVHPVNASGRGRTLFGRSAEGNGIHLVVLGDGYREDQQAQFREHVENLVNMMRNDVGMATHFDAWNVHMVETPSVDSGSDDNFAQDVRDTVYGTGYFCQSVSRLICGDQSAMFGVAIEEYPNFDQILVLVNDTRYGGSGGNIAISSTSSLEIALHEMGHSIAGLADEYVDRYLPDTSILPFVEGQFANVSSTNDETQVPWSHWFFTGPAADPTQDSASSSVVGVFEGAYYRELGFFRPTEDSLMRSYDGNLGPVNSEQWALSVYARARPISNISPASRRMVVSAGETVTFSVDPTFGGDLQSVEWQLDSRVIPDSGLASPSVSLSFPAGEYQVSVKVRDISGLIRKPEPHEGTFNWDWIVVSE